MQTKIPNSPLTPAVFHILVALSTGERHGYGIMKQVEVDSQGKVTMGPGTLYGSLKRMLEAGLVRESDARVDPKMDEQRRIFYRITESGPRRWQQNLSAFNASLRSRSNGIFSQRAYPMPHKQKVVQILYRRVLTLYPRPFRERFGESMQQTFNDRYNERKEQLGVGVFGFVLWMFLDTVIGICRERYQLMTEGGMMHITRKNLGLSACMSLLLILPLMIMEIVNRRHLNEGFPFVLFFGFWLAPFVICLILLPIAQAWWTRNHGVTDQVVTQSNSLLTNPKSTAVISLLMILVNVIRMVLLNLEWEPLKRLLEGPNPGLGFLLSATVIIILNLLFPVAGIIAGRPIINTLRAGGSLVVHPLHLVIVAALSLLFAVGFVFLLVDQWPCFVGVPNCD